MSDVTRAQEPEPGWRTMGRTLRRARAHWRVLAIGLGAALVAALSAAFLVTPIYTSQSVVIHREVIPVGTLLGRDTPEETQRQRGARLRDMVLARTNVEAILAELDLFPEERASGGLQSAIDAFLKGADCKVNEDTFTLRVAYPEPGLAYAATQKLAESLVRAAARSREQRAVATRDFVAAQRDEAARELHQNEENLAQFLAAHPEFAQDSMAVTGQAPAGASIRAAQRRAASGASDVSALEQHRAQLQRRLQTSSGRASNDTSDRSGGEERAAARREMERATSELAELRTRYTDAHPDVLAARRRQELAQRSVAELDRRTGMTTSIPEAAVATEVDAVKQRIDLELHALENSLARARQDRASAAVVHTDEEVVDLETQWLSLNRDVLESRERHDQLERRFFQASIVANLDTLGDSGPMSVIDPAFLPDRPSARGRWQVGLSVFSLALAVTLALLWLLAFTDDRIVDAEQLERLRLVPAVVVIPRPRGMGKAGSP